MRCPLFSSSLIFGLVLIQWSVLCCPAAGDSAADREGAARFLYREFRDVKTFGMIAVSLVGQAEQIGLKTEEMTQHAKAKFREYFSGVRLEDISGDSSQFLSLLLKRDRTVGNITFRIWVLGEEYPLVYHIKCDAGNFDNPSIWTEETLGHGTKTGLKESIPAIMDEMLKTLAVAFFKVKAQEM
jgi:hypothetical protein